MNRRPSQIVNKPVGEVFNLTSNLGNSNLSLSEMAIDMHHIDKKFKSPIILNIEEYVKEWELSTLKRILGMFQMCMCILRPSHSMCGHVSFRGSSGRCTKVCTAVLFLVLQNNLNTHYQKNK